MDNAHPPGGRHTDSDPVVVPLLLITPAVAFIVTLPLFFAFALPAALLALAAAVVVGAPVLKVARSLGLRGVAATAALGAACGAVAVYIPAAVIAAAYWRRVGWVDSVFLLSAIAIGGATGGIYATIHDSHHLPPPLARRRMVAMVALAAALPWIGMYVKLK